MTAVIKRKQHREIELQQKKAIKKLNKMMVQRTLKVHEAIQFEAANKGLPPMSDAVSVYTDAIGDGYDIDEIDDLITNCWNLGIYSKPVADLIWQLIVQPTLILRGLDKDEHVINVLLKAIIDRSTIYAFDPRFIIEFSLTDQGEGHFYLKVGSAKADPYKQLFQLTSNAIQVIKAYR